MSVIVRCNICGYERGESVREGEQWIHLYFSKEENGLPEQIDLCSASCSLAFVNTLFPK